MRSDAKVDEHGQFAMLIVDLHIAFVELLKVLAAVFGILVGELLGDELAIGHIEHSCAVVVVVP